MELPNVSEQSISGWATSGLMGAVNLIERLAYSQLPFSQDDLGKLAEYHDRIGKVLDHCLDEATKK